MSLQTLTPNKLSTAGPKFTSKTAPKAETTEPENGPTVPTDSFQSSENTPRSQRLEKLAHVATRVATGVAGAAVGIAAGVGCAMMGSAVGGALAASAPGLLGVATAVGVYYAFSADDATSRAFAGAFAGVTAGAMASSVADPGTLLEFAGEFARAGTAISVVGSGIIGAVRGARLPDALTKSDGTFKGFLDTLNGKSDD